MDGFRNSPPLCGTSIIFSPRNVCSFLAPRRESRSVPSKTISPVALQFAGSNPITDIAVIVLPQPLSPTTASRSPFARENDKSDTIVFVPLLISAVMVRCFTSSNIGKKKRLILRDIEQAFVTYDCRDLSYFRRRLRDVFRTIGVYHLARALSTRKTNKNTANSGEAYRTRKMSKNVCVC